MKMINYFKKFADYVNSKRKKSFNFYQMVLSEAKNSKKILEIGCNVRPINEKRKTNILHGLDPDPLIDLVEVDKKFDDFFNVKIEDFKTDNSYDLIVLDMVWEHVENNYLTFDKLDTLLEKNGKIMIHAPSNMHPFSILNQMLPHNIKVKVLKIFRPWSKVGEITGWKSYYHKCNILSLKRMAKSKNFIVTKSYFDYNASDYFAFFPPLFLLITLYEKFISILRLSCLCASFVVVLERKN